MSARPVTHGHRLNLALVALHLGAQGVLLFVLPLASAAGPGWLLWLVPALALLNNPLWSLLHEGVHNGLYPRARINDALSRALAIAYGSPFRILRTGHLLHHRFNRSPLDSAEVYAPPRARLPAAAGYYFQLFGGLYLTQVLSPLAFFMPRAWLERARTRFARADTFNGFAAAQLLQPAAVREIRVDGALILALYGTSAWCYGAARGWLVVALALRGFMISFLDYIYHYGTPLGDLLDGRNLALPRWLAVALLNFNLHGVHHQHPTSPWWELPALFRADACRMHGGYFSAALAQLRGPLRPEQLPATARP